MDRAETLAELAQFYKELKAYKRHLSRESLTNAQRRYINSLREKLVGKAGALKSMVIELTGKEHISRFGMVHNIWDAGLTAQRVSDICDVALDYCIDAVNEAIGKLESTPLADTQLQKVKITESPKGFIAHEGMTGALNKLKEFLDALGISYLIAEIEPSDGRLVEGQVDWTQGQADFALILATRGKVINKKTKAPQIGTNVADELGRARAIFKNRTILLLEKGVEAHTNISGIVHERFTPQSMDKAFTKIVNELKNWGFLRVGKAEE